jgi:ceramide glucosyltransferase
MVGYACLSIAALYSALTLIGALVWRVQSTRSTNEPGGQPAVTILKPLCGTEPGLYEHLRSFCTQDYPSYQVVFGVRERNDPSLAVVDRLFQEFPDLALDVVVDGRQFGSNYKNSNLMNMLEAARHDVLVIADSDAMVEPDYLGIVTAPLRTPAVGLVTCIYRGVPTDTVWSRLGAMYINEWFMPSVLLAWLFGHTGYASGQTLCFRRDTLAAIGGLKDIADHLADDYRLGELIRRLGLRIVVSRYEIAAQHHEVTMKSMIEHQLRWMQTLRLLRPASFRFIFLTFSQPLALAGAVLVELARFNHPAGWAWGLLAFTLAAQIALHVGHRVRQRTSILADLPLIPARDVLLCWIWWRSLFTSRIKWRGSEFELQARGLMRRV